MFRVRCCTEASMPVLFGERGSDSWDEVERGVSER